MIFRFYFHTIKGQVPAGSALFSVHPASITKLDFSMQEL